MNTPLSVVSWPVLFCILPTSHYKRTAPRSQHPGPIYTSDLTTALQPGVA